MGHNISQPPIYALQLVTITGRVVAKWVTQGAQKMTQLPNTQLSQPLFIPATKVSTSAMTMNLAPILMLPIPLPHQQSSLAPHFYSNTPSTLGTYLLDYKILG